MWLITPVGFFSIVCKAGDTKAGTLTVRARVKSDLEALREQCLPSLGAVEEGAGTDYRYRASAKRSEVAKALAKMVQQIDYANFKNEVAGRQGEQRAKVYSKVWDVLYDLEELTAGAPKPQRESRRTTSAPKMKPNAFGGIVVDKSKRVLLRRPRGDFDGYVWTFPKGRAYPGETPEQTALREVQEETGYSATIIGGVAGAFIGGTSVTRYFLMTPLGAPSAFDSAETSAIKWATLDDAAKLIGMTTNTIGRARDLAVLQQVRLALMT